MYPPCLFVSLTMLLCLCFCFYYLSLSVLLFPPLSVYSILYFPGFSLPHPQLYSFLWLISLFNSLSLFSASLVFVFTILVHHVEKYLFWGRNNVPWIINNNSCSTIVWEETRESEKVVFYSLMSCLSILRHHSHTLDVKSVPKSWQLNHAAF